VQIAYLSADFYRHATAYLAAGLFELHDRPRFEVLGVSFEGDDASDLRVRLVKSFDRFYDVTARSDEDAAKLLASLQVDIAVDLKGYTQDARTGILAHRPAPIQISYLGYPGTMGASFMDYVIADATVLPFDQQPFYTEKIIHLPDCYQVNDSRRAIAEHTPSRPQAGLPEQGFVFCCFNNNYKITAPVFEVWMRLLCAVPGSVLCCQTTRARTITCASKPRRAGSILRVSCSRTASRSTGTSRANASPTSSSTPCRTMPTPP